MLINCENPHGGDIYRNNVLYDFSANTSPLGTPPEVVEAVKKSAEHLCDYPDPYCSELRSGLSDLTGVEAESIICGNGAAELIFSFAGAASPKRALIVEPTFCEYEKALKAVNCEVSHFQLSEDRGYALPDDIGERTGNFDLVVLCNPNNPTGRAYPRYRVRSLALACAENGARLLLDECFCDLTSRPEKHSIADLSESLPNVFILKAFTKNYGLAGARLGYAICSDGALLNRMCSLGQVWNVSVPAQAAGIAALRCGDFLIRERRMIERERLYLTSELRRLGFEAYDSDVNFILFKSNLPLFEELLRRRILIRNCNNFYGLDGRYYRCAVKKHKENLALIYALEEIVNG